MPLKGWLTPPSPHFADSFPFLMLCLLLPFYTWYIFHRYFSVTPLHSIQNLASVTELYWKVVLWNAVWTLLVVTIIVSLDCKLVMLKRQFSAVGKASFKLSPFSLFCCFNVNIELCSPFLHSLCVTLMPINILSPTIKEQY